MKKLLALSILVFISVIALSGQTLSVAIIAQTNIACYSQCTGSVTVSASGGTAPYTYLWMPGNITTATMSNACAGSYTCTVTDAAMATATVVALLTEPPALAVVSSYTAVTCGGLNGAAAVSVTGGVGAYTYTWSPGNCSSAVYNSLTSGSYSCTILDANGCSITATVNVPNTPVPLVAINSSWNVSCFGGNDGAASSVPYAGTPPYTYTWSNGDNDSILNNVVSGSYTLTLTDAIGCTATETVVITQPPLLSITGLSPSPATYCEGQQVGLNPTSAIGGTAPYNFMASPYSVWGNTVEAHNATYTLLITDANGCTASNTITLTPGPNTMAMNPIVVHGPCNQNTSSITLNVTGGSGVYSYLWSPGNMTTASVANLSPGNYLAEVTDNTGCPLDSFFNIVDSCAYVYPGDANQDGVANNLDILDIGIANGATGYMRSAPTINWVPQFCWPWGQTLASGTDFKYVDCDGNGSVQPADTNAVVLNFGYTHNVRIGTPVYEATAPDLSVTANQDTLGAGWRGSLNVALGTAANPASNVYGVAFTLTFDPNMIDAATFSMNENGSWMGIPGSNLMGVVLHEGTGTGSVQVAITRLNQADTSGFGDIATIGFNATNNLAATGNSQNVNFAVSNLTVLSANESTQAVNAIGDSIVVADPGVITGTEQGQVSAVSLYPNPAQNNVNVMLGDNYAGDNSIVVLRDISGRAISCVNSGGSNMVTFNLESCPAGVYFISVESANGEITTQKLIIAEK